MNLTEKSSENVQYMVDQITTKLRMINIGAIKPEHFDGEMYTELKELYDYVMKKDNFSPSEMQSIAEELGQLKK
ncbi:DUF1128 domain-containing protein [Bacillus sp. FJAT-42376]|uniref:DUF1128 domain-containing protein n=1 Tax=Bacillus sp. FJAT-42376 TaxID=2014076 RepID=UPI000F504A4E|nr:DUF1128 domain-containing protein [Bacillus sp. FJAT-42376]AZB41668.1 DUF1128 domain-containing protein [Bacillus sp. FJAT-42376]